jgi:signal peptidase II
VTESSVLPAPARARSAGWLPLVGVAATVLLVDQLTKEWALRALDDRSIDVVGSLRLHLVFNTGSAFSIASGFGPVLAIVGVVVVALLVVTGRDVQGWPARVALGLVVGGAVGNLVDRALRDGDGVLGGAVVDFIDLQWWPVFNVADMAITVGALLLALTIGRPSGADAGSRPA